MRVVSRKKGKTNNAEIKIKRPLSRHRQGKLIVVGIGPGSLDLLTFRAEKAIRESQVIVGYKTYIELLGNLSRGKELISTGMTQEVERVGLAIAKAREGKKVCLISSGDAGVYGMSGLALELLNPELEDNLEIEIIPGVMSALSCAAILGSPLMHDFAVISLSDLLTDLRLIEDRIAAAARSDFVIALYNPKRKKRVEPFKMAWNILMRCRKAKTPVGIVRNCERRGQKTAIIYLKDLLKFKDIDMATTIIVGNSRTYLKGKYMITPRGYRLNQGSVR